MTKIHFIMRTPLPPKGSYDKDYRHNWPNIFAVRRDFLSTEGDETYLKSVFGVKNKPEKKSPAPHTFTTRMASTIFHAARIQRRVCFTVEKCCFTTEKVLFHAVEAYITVTKQVSQSVLSCLTVQNLVSKGRTLLFHRITTCFTAAHHVSEGQILILS